MRYVFVRAQSCDDRLALLKAELAKFYDDNTNYYAHAEGNKDLIYRALLPFLRGNTENFGERLRIIEIGAGRTGLPAFLRGQGLDGAVDFVAHDINKANIAFYEKNGIRHIICPVAEITSSQPFDLCLSTYVFEHLIEPHEYLGTVDRLLAPNGRLVIVCPKYVFPGYVPPAIRWLPWWDKHTLTCFLSLSNIWTKISRKPNFWICIEPAVFKRAWRRDYDAVHMVSPSDLKAALRPAYRVRSLPLDRPTMKARLFDALCVMSIVAERRSATDAPRAI